MDCLKNAPSGIFDAQKKRRRDLSRLGGLASLRDLPDIEKLEDPGILERPISFADLNGALGLRDQNAELTDEADD